MDAVTRPYAGVGRRAHDRPTMERAGLLAYLHKTILGSITPLHWKLLKNPAFRTAYGFIYRVPVQTQALESLDADVGMPNEVERVTEEIVYEAKEIRPSLPAYQGIN